MDFAIRKWCSMFYITMADLFPLADLRRLFWCVCRWRSERDYTREQSSGVVPLWTFILALPRLVWLQYAILSPHYLMFELCEPICMRLLVLVSLPCFQVLMPYVMRRRQSLFPQRCHELQRPWRTSCSLLFPQHPRTLRSDSCGPHSI